MKLSTASSTALIYSSVCAALEGAQESVLPTPALKLGTPKANSNTRFPKRDLEPELELAERSGNTCSIGIGRVSGSINWDATIYNVPQAERQNVNIVGTATFVSMDKGQTMTVTGPPTVTVTNVDNAPVYTYNEPELMAPLSDLANGLTKVELHFSSGNTNWTIADCGAGNVIFSAGRESWSCDFAC